MRNSKVSIIILVALLSSVFPLNVFAVEQVADSVYLNANIYTVDEEFSKAEAIAIKGQYLVQVGSNEEVKKLIGPNTKVVDFKGKTVIPGIIEGHMHFPGEGQKLLQLDAFWKPKDEILALVKAEADRLADGEWIIGRGWNQAVWDDPVFPTKEDLDAVAPNNPVALVRTCGHAIWANTLALKLGNITNDTPNPQGGEILRDANGEATGVLTDTAASAVRSKIPPFNEERQKEALLLAQEELFSYGITTSMDAGSSVQTIGYMKELYEKEALKIRVYMMVSTGESAQEYYKSGPEIGLFGNRLTMNCIKFFSDGSLGARSAWMLEEYSDRADHTGNGRYTDEEFYELIKEARIHGFQVATHAIGDAANKQTIDVYEKVLKEMPLDDPRYRIEHFQIVRLEDIKRIKEIGIIPAMQSVHATSDKNMAEDRVGSERIKGAYAWRKVLDAGNIMPNGSDAAVELVNPYHGLYAAVTRMGRDGEPVGGWYPEENMTREEALRSFTNWPAFAQFEEKLKGSLEVGKLADFAVLDRDLMTCPDRDIKDIMPLSTVVGGEVVYDKNNKYVTIMSKGMPIKFDVNPVLINGRTYASAKVLFDNMGIEYKYDTNNNFITATKDSLIKEISVNKFDDQLYVPVRQVAEYFGYIVNWYPESMSVSIGK